MQLVFYWNVHIFFKPQRVIKLEICYHCLYLVENFLLNSVEPTRIKFRSILHRIHHGMNHSILFDRRQCGSPMKLAHDLQVVIHLGIFQGEYEGIYSANEVERSCNVFVQHFDPAIASQRNHICFLSERRSEWLGEPLCKNDQQVLKWTYISTRMGFLNLPIISVQSHNGNLSNGSTLDSSGLALGTKTMDLEHIFRRPTEKFDSSFAGLLMSRNRVTATSLK